MIEQIIKINMNNSLWNDEIWHIQPNEKYTDEYFDATVYKLSNGEIIQQGDARVTHIGILRQLSYEPLPCSPSFNYETFQHAEEYRRLYTR